VLQFAHYRAPICAQLTALLLILVHKDVGAPLPPRHPRPRSLHWHCSLETACLGRGARNNEPHSIGRRRPYLGRIAAQRSSARLPRRASRRRSHWRKLDVRPREAFGIHRPAGAGRRASSHTGAGAEAGAASDASANERRLCAAHVGALRTVGLFWSQMREIDFCCGHARVAQVLRDPINAHAVAQSLDRV